MRIKVWVFWEATKFEKIFVVLLTRASCSVRATVYLSKSRWRFFKNKCGQVVDIIQTLKMRNEQFLKASYIILWDKWKRFESFVISDQRCSLIWMSNIKFESWMGSGLALYFRNSCFQICLFSTLIFFLQDFTFLEKKLA